MAAKAKTPAQVAAEKASGFKAQGNGTKYDKFVTTVNKAPDSKGNAGEWHTHADGSKVFVAAARPREKASAFSPAGSPGASTSQPGDKPSTDPFWTPDQQQGKADYEFNRDNSLTDLQAQLKQAQIQHDYAATQNERSAVVNKAASDDNAAARGIFQSSVRDAATNDIEAQKALQAGLINDTFKATQDSVNAKLAAISAANTSFYQNFNAQGAGNALSAAAQIVPGDPQGDAGQPAPAAKAAPVAKPDPSQWVKTSYQGVDSKGHPGEWHVHADGSKVFVPKGKK
jgi:hypothetical protein